MYVCMYVCMVTCWVVRDSFMTWPNLCVWHDPFICVPRLIYAYGMNYSYVWNDSPQGDTQSLVDLCVNSTGMTHSHVWHDSLKFGLWPIHMCGMTYAYMWHDTFICVTRLMYICGVTYSYVWHDLFICVAWRIHMCDMAQIWATCSRWGIRMSTALKCRIHMWELSWLIYICAMTHSYGWHAEFICVAWLIHMCDISHIKASHIWLIHMCDIWTHMSYSYVWHFSHQGDVVSKYTAYEWNINICEYIYMQSHTYDLFICVTCLTSGGRAIGWLRLLGSLKS